MKIFGDFVVIELSSIKNSPIALQNNQNSNKSAIIPRENNNYIPENNNFVLPRENNNLVMPR